MRTSNLSSLEYLLLAILAMSLIDGHGQDAKKRCSVVETNRSTNGTTAIFTREPFPWKVTVDLSDHVTIENSELKTKCTTDLSSVVTVFVGKGNLIYLRSLEIANDQVFI